MQYLVFGVGAALGLYLLLRGAVAADPKVLAKILKVVGVALAAGLVILLAVTGRWSVLMALAFFVMPLVARWKALLGHAKAAAGPSAGQTSEVTTASLRMWLEHDSGRMDGEVLAGPFAGRRLSDLSQDQILDLLDGVQGQDPQSASLLEGYLDRAHPDWRDGPAAGPDPDAGPRRDPRATGMTVDEACEVLGVAPEATEAEVKDAHRRLMMKNHPDQGGSTYLAAKINLAKDVLLRKLGRKS